MPLHVRWLSMYALCLALAMPHCALSSSTAKPSETIIVPAGTRSPALGVSFDLSYEPTTDNIIPGYHILQVGMGNHSLKVIELNPMADAWYLVDRRGKKQKAIISLRRTDPDVWASLPVRLRRLIEYPLMINVSEIKSIDLLFVDRIELSEFREVIYESSTLGKTIRVYARETTQ